MNRQPYQTPGHWWSPRPSAFWMRLWRPWRRRHGMLKHGLGDIEVRGLDHLAAATSRDQGVLITPNHASHADPFVLLEAADQLVTPFYFMTAWQVFAKTHGLGRRVLRQHGCFSINREGYDLRAFRCATSVLAHERRPLVIFPEGEVFHLNDRVTPFRRGAATAALFAARQSERPVACVPCGMKFQFVNDPSEALQTLAGRIEQAFGWRTCEDQPLVTRARRLVEGWITARELAHLDARQSGSLVERSARLIGVMLGRLEDRYRLTEVAWSTPERVKRLRFHVIRRMESAAIDSSQQQQCRRDLDHLFQIIQLFSYPADYLAGQPTLERLAETLDKLEEDVLGAPTAGVRGLQRAVISFGEPLIVTPEMQRAGMAVPLTQRLQAEVQQLLDNISSGTRVRSPLASPAAAPALTPFYASLPSVA